MAEPLTLASCQRFLRSLLARWKSRKFLNARRAKQALGRVDAHWRHRIDDVIACPDNRHIHRVPAAGQLIDGALTMHNGIRVGGLGYCGAGMLNMLIQNRGVHEPQEERAFGEVLPYISAGGTMLELGAYWSFYSLWFSQQVPAADCYLLEPHPANIRSGQLNFRLNQQELKHQGATFDQAYAGGRDGLAKDGVPVVTVDTHCRRRGIQHLAILHADIQGAEADMLRGAQSMLAAAKIDFLFISTHSSELHDECIAILNSHGYRILAAADEHQTYSVDGLIVAGSPQRKSPSRLAISRKPEAQGPSVRSTQAA